MSTSDDTGDDEDPPTPPVPPTRSTPIPREHTDVNAGVIERERTGTCDCGGRLSEETVRTGRVIVWSWDRDQWDPDEYELTISSPEEEHRVRCNDCPLEYYY